MKEVKRVLAYLVGLFFILASGWILAITTGWNLPYDSLGEGLFWIKAHPWEDVIIAAFLLIVGVLPFLRPRRPRVKPAFTSPSRLGEIRVTYEAIQEIIIRSAQALTGIRQVQPNLRQREDGIEVLIEAQFNPEVIIPGVSEELQAKIKEDVEHYTGIQVAEVKVLVRSIETTRQSRLR